MVGCFFRGNFGIVFEKRTNVSFFLFCVGIGFARRDLSMVGCFFRGNFGIVFEKRTNVSFFYLCRYRLLRSDLCDDRLISLGGTSELSLRNDWLR
jgi:hypothetical protein